MGYQKLTPGQEEQILKMSNDGKSNEEVADFFKKTYQVKIEPWKVSYIKAKVEKDLRGGIPEGGGEAEERRRKKANKKYFAKKRRAKVVESTERPDNSTDDIKQLVDRLHAELDAFSSYIIHKIRIELIKRIAEARKKRIDAGEDVEPIKEEDEVGEV